MSLLTHGFLGFLPKTVAFAMRGKVIDPPKSPARDHFG